MKLYIVSNETLTRYVIGTSANDARHRALESGIGGHKINRRVWRTAEGVILEVDAQVGVISEEVAIALLRRYGYNMDGSEYKAPVKLVEKRTGKRGRPKNAPADRKVCRRCGCEKPIADFPPRSGGGYQSYCRNCKITIDREYRKNKKNGG